MKKNTIVKSFVSAWKLISMVNQLMCSLSLERVLGSIASEYFCDIRAKKNLYQNNSGTGFFALADVPEAIDMVSAL